MFGLEGCSAILAMFCIAFVTFQAALGTCRGRKLFLERLGKLDGYDSGGNGDYGITDNHYQGGQGLPENCFGCNVTVSDSR